MINKFFVDNNYNIELLVNMAEPWQGEQVWQNSIIVRVDADSTANQYLIVTGNDISTNLPVTPGQVNEIDIPMAYWELSGETTIQPYKNGSAVSGRAIMISFPDVINGAGMISKVEETIGYVYSMSGTQYAEDTVKDIQQEINNIQNDKQDKLVAGSGIEIDPSTNTISATGGGGGGGIDYKTDEQDTGLKSYLGYASGAPVYQRSFRVAANFSNNYQEIEFEPAISTLIDFDVFLEKNYGTSYQLLPFYFNDNNYLSVGISKTTASSPSKTFIGINKGYQTSIPAGSNFVITMRYTKPAS